MNRPIALRNTFSILFFIHRGKSNKNKEHPIYCRLTIQGKSREFSTQIWVLNDKWNPKASRVNGTNEAARAANHTINNIRTNLSSIRGDLMSKGKTVAPEAIVNEGSD